MYPFDTPTREYEPITLDMLREESRDDWTIEIEIDVSVFDEDTERE